MYLRVVATCVGTSCADNVPPGAPAPRLTSPCFARMQTGGREVQRATPRYNATALVRSTITRYGVPDERPVRCRSSVEANEVLFECPRPWAPIHTPEARGTATVARAAPPRDPRKGAAPLDPVRLR